MITTALSYRSAVKLLGNDHELPFLVILLGLVPFCKAASVLPPQRPKERLFSRCRCAHVYTYEYVCPSVCLSVCLSVYYVCLPARRPADLGACMPVCMYIYMSPIPFGLMRLGILSSIINTQANFCYTLLIFVHGNRRVLHMTRIAYIIHYMPYTSSYIPLMIYHALYIRCYILCVTYYI